MNNHTAMPTIEFGEGTDYDALWSLLRLAALGLASLGAPSKREQLMEAVDAGHEGILWRFYLEGGVCYEGMMVHWGEDGNDMSVRVFYEGAPTDTIVTFDTDLLTKVVYL